MPDQSDVDQLQRRDGTSQADRHQPALKPDYAKIDERSFKDFLAFARQYSKKLRFFDVVDGVPQDVGDWSGFLPDDLALDSVVAFMNDPESLPPEQAQAFAQPHRVLFLTFLHLLRQAQAQLNGLTGRHLDYYYGQVLGLTRRGGIPDRVNVLVDLAAGTDQVWLPAGTALNAGPDSLGQDRHYHTEQDTVISRAQVAELRSIFADQQVMGIRQAREAFVASPNESRLLQLLQIALGDPLPGDPLPEYGPEVPVTRDLLFEHKALIDFAGNKKNEGKLGLDLSQADMARNFTDLRGLMRLKQQRDRSETEWNTINRLLEKAGKKREPSLSWDIANPKDFEANLSLAMGGPPSFDGLPQVEDIYDLYHQRVRQDAKDWIRDRLYFEEYDDFVQMMQLKIRIDSEWAEIFRILREAGLRQGSLDPDFPVRQPKEAGAFEANLVAALGSLVWPAETTDIDSYYRAFQAVEAHFYMTAEQFSYFIAVAQQEIESQATLQEWLQVDAILAEAYVQKIYAERRAALKSIHQSQGFMAMIEFAAGDAQDTTELAMLERLLRDFVPNKDEKAFLLDINRRVSEEETVTEAEWSRVYQIVELAQRRREDVGLPTAQRVEWLNLYPSEDATGLRVSLGVDSEQETPRWETFGRGQPATDRDSPPPTSFGWAVSSPLLLLSQGNRTISLLLGFEADQFDSEKISTSLAGDSPFQIQLSTEKEWVEPENVTITVEEDYHAAAGVDKPEGAETLPAIGIKVILAENVAPLSVLPAEDAGLVTKWPVLRLRLRPTWPVGGASATSGHYRTDYQPFRKLILRRTQLKVEVVGLTPSHIQNDETTFRPGKPFEPFGTSALAGAHLYLGHAELSHKRLDTLTFAVEWMGKPDNLSQHYQNYTTIKTTDRFSAKVSLIDRRLALVLDNGALLFGSSAAGATGHSISLPGVPAAIEAGRQGYVYQPLAEIETGDDLQSWSRYLQWELNPPDFQQQAYPALAAQKSIELAAAIANKTAGTTVTAAAYQINPPYVPKIKRLSIGYSAATEISSAGYGAAAQVDRIFHIYPFGYSEFEPDTALAPTYFLPQFDYEGELYIGIRAAKPPQNLSLLFQMAEGSADPELELTPVSWSYLSGNRWLSLEAGNLLRDTTRGLINSGIITFSLPPARPSTLLPPDLTWIRAAIPSHKDSVCDTVAIHTQAVSASFVDRDNAADHLSQPLPPDSITDLVERQAAIKGVRQPYTSYGGRMPEQEFSFYTRISERLRHKQRALTMWDYEHLILDRFPEIYKAKCLPADPAGPGTVEVVVIPDIRHKRPFNPFEPKAPANLIADIETYLAGHTPAFATVKVKNAHYVPVKLRFGVRFRPDYNEGFYKQHLNEALNRFLSPWAYEGGAEIEIGGRVYANVLINFIEEQPYVDYVAEIRLFTSEDGKSFKPVTASGQDGYWVETERPDGVLVAARQHEIDIISETGYEVANFSGINYMKLELDFIVG